MMTDSISVHQSVCFKPNWHLEAITEKLSQVASGARQEGEAQTG
jgi:hypothetical protein